MPFFSIIVPVYNNGEAILPLLNSLKHQNYDDFELIIVDDGSKDNSKALVNAFKDDFKYFKYILKKNGGTSSARNTGLSNAEGEYILFADADDKYEENALNLLFNFLKSYKSDLLCFDYYNYFLNGKKEIALNLTKKKENINIEKTIANFLNYKYINKYASAVWNKVYRKSIIDNNKLKFREELVLGEDLIFNIEYFCCVEQIDSVDYTLYNYLQTANSIMRSYRKNNVDYIKKYIPILFDLINNYNCKKLEYMIYEFYISNFFGIINNEIKNPSYQDGKMKIINFCNETKKFTNKMIFRMSIKNFTYILLIKTRIWKLVYFILYKK